MWRIFLIAAAIGAILIPATLLGAEGLGGMTMPPGPETALVNVANETNSLVEFYVDGDFRAAIEPHAVVVVTVAEGYRLFTIDKMGRGPHVMERVYVPNGVMTYTIR